MMNSEIQTDSTMRNLIGRDKFRHIENLRAWLATDPHGIEIAAFILAETEKSKGNEKAGTPNLEDEGASNVEVLLKADSPAFPKEKPRYILKIAS